MKNRNIIMGITILLVVVMMVVGLCACKKDAEKNSEKEGAVGVKVSALESEWDDLTFTKTQNESGYRYYAEDSSFTITAEADKNENITSIEIYNTVVNTSALSDETELLRIMNKSSASMTMYDICTAYTALNASHLEEALGGKDTSETKADFAEKYSALFAGENMTVGNWTISATLDRRNDTATITATYASK